MLNLPIYPKYLNEIPHWYALHVRSRHEKKVHEHLLAKEIETFLPLRKSLHQWSDRKKWVELPLFRNYVFTKIALKHRLPVLQTNGAIRLVTFKSIPAVIPEWQIEGIKKVLTLTQNIDILENFVTGEEVEVKLGPFVGLRGVVIQQKNSARLYISIEAIGRSVGVEINILDVQKVNNKEHPGAL